MLYPILTGFSALRFHCTPPIVHELTGPFPDISTRKGKYLLRPGTVLLGGIEMPVHLQVSNRSELHRIAGVKLHLSTHDLPGSSVLITDYDVAVTSPLATLLSMASSCTVVQLALAMHEFCGTFAVYRPTPEIRGVLQDLIRRRMPPTLGGWRPSLTSDGTLTDLWQREPPVSAAELRSFASRASGERGIKRFRQAMELVHENAASPFEVQVAMLLGSPRRDGGEELGPFELNRRIPLSSEARRIAEQSVCYGDIVLPARGNGPDIILECQGNAYHLTPQQAASDDNRRLALQSMGYTVVPLRYNQVADPTRFNAVTRYLFDLLGQKRMPKTTQIEQKAAELRGQLFVDWWKLGSP